MFEVLQCEEIGMSLTDSMAMSPAASVSGFYLSHPESKYFSVGRIGDDQVQDIAERRAMDKADVAKMLAPNL
jgi:5-methyltetrahydrofolate--homocysteine methyltransferase